MKHQILNRIKDDFDFVGVCRPIIKYGEISRNCRPAADRERYGDGLRLPTLQRVRIRLQRVKL
jgi:hypothetical protein